jgi:hypothetical protein
VRLQVCKASQEVFVDATEEASIVDLTARNRL